MIPRRPTRTTTETISERPEANVLAAWRTLELLEQSAYRDAKNLAGDDPKRIIPLEGSDPVWIPESSDQAGNYHHVPLGMIDLGVADRMLMEAFGHEEEFEVRNGQKVVIASIVVDSRGLFLSHEHTGLSSFAWALPHALRKNFEAMNAWPRGRFSMREQITENLEYGLPLQYTHIQTLHRALVNHLGLPPEMVLAPTFLVKSRHRDDSGKRPESLIMNSFHLDDIADADYRLENGGGGTAIRRYLGLEDPNERIENVLEHPDRLTSTLAPIRFPAGAWPSPGGHALTFLQQAAVNATREEMEKQPGLMGVNGPPGTGKTTLLRDVVAAAVVDRATAMAGFADPKDAMQPGPGISDQPFYLLHESLIGHEVLVASSNNKAVENVSKELPLLDNLDHPGAWRHLHSIADAMADPSFAKDPQRREGIPVRPQESCWGLIAAPLGNASNRARFLARFWADQDFSIRQYLFACMRGPAMATFTTKDDKVVRRESLIMELGPPLSPEDARRRWNSARERFLALKDELDADLVECEMAVIGGDGHGRAREAWLHADQLVKTLQEMVSEGSQALDAIRADRKAAARDLETVSKRRGRRSQRYSREIQGAQERVDELDSYVEAIAEDIEISRKSLSAALRERDYARNALEAHETPMAILLRSIPERRLDEAAFAGPRDDLLSRTPWLPDSIHRKRRELFSAALDLHRAFIEVNAKAMHANLTHIKSVLEGYVPDGVSGDRLQALWTTLFLVVPVISTTFASAGRMLKYAPADTIGWLLIDEAGQARPQQALGALLRARRAIAVGDPRQIEPVVTMPARLIRSICDHHGVDPDTWSAPKVSVQTLADRASRITARFSPEDPETVGLPLLVHRRCADPMFSVSNAIAYSGAMVHRTAERDPCILEEAWGPSSWHDIRSPGILPKDGKFSRKEAAYVMEMFRHLHENGVLDPDVFVISPFKQVATGMRGVLKEHDEMMFEITGDKIGEWAKDRIGTIHTFQGREADTVILLLGAGRPTQRGARDWAASRPNILNVAVSRARRSLHVIGDVRLWRTAGNRGYVAKLEEALAMRDGNQGFDHP